MEIQNEQEKLDYVVTEIESQLSEAIEQTKGHKTQLREIRKFIWQDLQIGYGADDFEVAQHLEEMKRRGREFGVDRQTVRKLKLLESSPYFGRIDFSDDQYPALEQLYIGIASLVDQNTKEHLIYDWRAPVASMFYDYGVGKAEYQCPAGTITGEIKLKRQFRIVDGQLASAFDSDLKVDDEILQDVLSKHADEKMRNIIYSIQRDQNLAIRDEQSQLLMVQGPAGSGKTSIALHRAAYLLYRYHASIDADNIVIFSPNQIFSDYISRVLPQLGEDNIGQATFGAFALKMLGEALEVEDLYTQLEQLSSQSPSPERTFRLQGIEFKNSIGFFRIINGYIAHLKNKRFSFDDVIIWDQTILTKVQCEELFFDTYQYLPIKKRLAKLRRRIRFLLDPIKKQKIQQLFEIKVDDAEYIGESNRYIKSVCIEEVNRDIQPLYNQLNTLLDLDIYQVYQELIQDPELAATLTKQPVPENWTQICKQTLVAFRNNQIKYEDVPPILYLKGRLEGWPDYTQIRHVIIDEAQDYSIFHFAIIKELFPKSTFTVLGDFNQRVQPYAMIGSYHDLEIPFAQTRRKTITLTKSYRSTREISAFTRDLLVSNQQIESMERAGEKPKVIRMDPNTLRQSLVTSVQWFYTQQSKSIALICKTAYECQQIAARLADQLDFSVITTEDEHFSQGVVIVPVYLAKGLEFDAVIVCNADSLSYGQESERKLLYTACTRALHYLHVYYQGELSPFIAEISQEKYQSIDGLEVTRNYR